MHGAESVADEQISQSGQLLRKPRIIVRLGLMKAQIL